MWGYYRCLTGRDGERERDSIIRERERDKEERKILKKESHWLSATWQAGINKNNLDFS